MIIETHSPEETREVGRKFGAAAKAGEVYALDGDLGAGKTVWSKGFAEGLGITEPITSPTFTIVQTYEGGRLTLNHFDVYRIEDSYEMDEIGYDDMIGGDGVSLIEWAVQIEDMLPEDTIFVTIERIAGREADGRRITVTGKEDLT